MKRLDKTSQHIIRNILGRIHCAESLEVAEKAVIDKTIGFDKLKKSEQKMIKDFIKKTHERNFIIKSGVMSGKI